MFNKKIQESNVRRCYCCRTKANKTDLFNFQGRWYHKEVCGKSHPHYNNQEEIVEDQEEFIDFEPTIIEKPVTDLNHESKTYIITAAVSNSPVHDGCFRTLQEVARFYNAELLIVPIKYHHEKDQSQISWDSRIEGFVIKKPLRLNENITLFAQVNINPTAVRPTSGMEVLCGTSSGILPHTKLELKTVPTPLDHVPKIITTTGAVTCPVFTDTKAGEKGLAAHHLGAVIVEVEDNKVFHLRHLSYADGVIYDLNNVFHADLGILPIGNVPGIVLGDAHVGFVDPLVYQGLFIGAESLVGRLKPKQLVWHDLLDSYSVCHHHKNPLQHIVKQRRGRNKIADEVNMCLRFIKGISDRFPDIEHLIVESNHNNHLDQWIANSDWKTDPVNAEFYLKVATLLASTADFKTNYGYTNTGAFELLFDDMFDGKIPYKFVYDSETYTIEDVIINFHGHNGANGSRGSALQFGRSGYKFFTGHTHTPTILDNCWTVGTMRRLNCEYLSGLSGWMNTMGLIYPNGTRALINIINGKYTISD